MHNATPILAIEKLAVKKIDEFSALLLILIEYRYSTRRFFDFAKSWLSKYTKCMQG